MAKVFDNPIDINVPWDGDQSTGGLPVKGARIEELLKRTLQQLSAQKFGAQRMQSADDGMATLRFFATENDAEIWEADPITNAEKVLSEVSFYSQPVADDYTLAARITQTLDTPMIKGASNVLRFTYNSYYGGDPTDVDTQDGTAKFTINGTTITSLTMSLKPGEEYSVDLGAYLTQDANRVRVEISNQHGKSRSWDFNVQAVEIILSIDDSFDESVIRDSAWNLRVRCRGVSAAVHVLIDGHEIGLSTISNTTHDFTVDANDDLAPGAHTIDVYAENSDYGIISQTIRRTFVKRGQTIPTICISGTAPDSVMLYGTAIIPYYFYHPNAEDGQEFNISIEARDREGNVLKTLTPQVVAVDANGASGMQELRFTATENQYLSAGNVIVAVKLGASTESTHTLAVTPAGVMLEKASECKVSLSAAGKTNADEDAETWQSKYNNATTCRVVRSSNFRLTGDNGFGNDRFLIKAGKRITLADWKPFEVDFGANSTISANRTGRTIEFEFETQNCTNTSAKIIDCMSGGVGFEVYADRAVLSCASGSIETRFGDEERIRIGFVINGNTTHCVNQTIDETIESDCNIAYIYVNGVIVRIMDYANSAWNQPQNEARNIVIGSDDCDVALYVVNGYDKALDYQKMIGNYAYDTPNLTDKIAIARRNDVLNSNNAVDFVKTCAALPNTPYIIWEMPSMPTSKSDPVTTNTEFVNPRWVEALGLAMASFTCTGHDQVLDGTSSLSYPDPYKNFGATYNGRWVINIPGEDPIEIVNYSITQGLEQGEVDMVHKVNFASSEGIGNILAMNMYQKILLGVARRYPDILTPPQASQESNGEEITYRHSLSGFPEIGWLRTYGEGGVANMRFLSLFNFINNKYSPSIFGLTNDGSAELWEVEDNVNFFTEELAPGVFENNKWRCKATDLYYARVPRYSPGTSVKYGVSKNAADVSRANNENAKLRRIHNWLVSCNPHLAERYRTLNGAYRSLTAPVTYGDSTYTHDTPSYRYAKFYAEKDAYLNIHSVAMYALFCEYMLGTDSFDKNMTMAIFNGIAYLFLRDTDTIAFWNNLGKLVFQSWHEWNDTYNSATGETGTINGETYDVATQTFEPNCTTGTPVFNGRLSALFDCLYHTCQAELKEMYASMRAAGLNADSFMAMFDGFREQWCEALYNVDAMGYANTARFDMAYGDKREAFKQFFKSRQRYMDSKYNANTSKPLELRLWGSGGGLALRYATPLYAQLNWGSGDVNVVRNINPGTPSLFPTTGATFSQTTVTVYDADLLTDVNSYYEGSGNTITETGLEGVSSSLDINGLNYCRRLKNLILDYSGKAANINLSNRVTEVGNSIALERLIIRNCPNVTGNFALQSDKIQEIDLRGTAASGVTVPETDSLTSVRLGANITALCFAGLPNLATLTAEGYEQMTEISIDGCPLVDTQSIIADALSAESSKLTSVTLSGVDWQNLNVNHLERLADLKAKITGRIRFSKGANAVLINFALKRKLIETWGNIDDPENPLYIDYAQRDIGDYVTISGQRYIAERGQYRLDVVPYNSNGNNFVSIKWSMQENNYATIDKDTGIITVTDIGSPESAPKATVSVVVTLTNGETLTDNTEVGFYDRPCQLGDYVYADGSFSDIYDATKTVVGVCFYINPDDPTQRLCVMPRDLPSYPWGLYSGDLPGIALSDSVGYDVYDIPTMDNISNRGIAGYYINESSYRDETSSGDADGFKILDTNSAMGQIGFATLWSNLGKYKAGTKLPYGMINTLRIINHRNIILGDSAVNLPIPQAIAGIQTTYQSLIQCMNDVVANNGNQGKYRQYYYPAASICNAYQPDTKQGEELADCFKAGKWFLPSGGELARLSWWHQQGYDCNNANAIFARPKDTGCFTPPTGWMWSSTETAQTTAFVITSGGDSNSATYGRNFKYIPNNTVRAIAAF